MRLSILDDLDVLQDGNPNERSQWIHLTDSQDLYEVGQWLFMNLGPESQINDHRRTNVRDILNTYYHVQEWTPKQKHMVGHAIIEYWTLRQLDRDPRFIF
jgi:hypothetical protein